MTYQLRYQTMMPIERQYSKCFNEYKHN